MVLTVETLLHVEVLRVGRVGELARVCLEQTTGSAVDEGDTAVVAVTHAGTVDQRHLEQHDAVLRTAAVVHREVVERRV